MNRRELLLLAVGSSTASLLPGSAVADTPPETTARSDTGLATEEDTASDTIEITVTLR